MAKTPIKNEASELKANLEIQKLKLETRFYKWQFGMQIVNWLTVVGLALGGFWFFHSKQIDIENKKLQLAEDNFIAIYINDTEKLTDENKIEKLKLMLNNYPHNRLLQNQITFIEFVEFKNKMTEINKNTSKASECDAIQAAIDAGEFALKEYKDLTLALSDSGFLGKEYKTILNQRNETQKSILKLKNEKVKAKC